MKTTVLLASALVLSLGGSPASAQAPTTPSTPAPAKEAAPPKRAADGPGKRPTVTPAGDKDVSAGAHHKHGGTGMGMGHHPGGMMMGGGMEDGCAMMAAQGTTMKVTNTPTGVTITMTAQTPEAVAKLQKMAENMRTRHEAHAK
jgi:hypothetical protein